MGGIITLRSRDSMSKKWIAFGLSALVLVGMIISCTKDVSSRPNFIFKSPPRQGVAASFMGQEITEEELFRGIENDIYEAQNRIYKIKMNRLKGHILENL